MSLHLGLGQFQEHSRQLLRKYCKAEVSEQPIACGQDSTEAAKVGPCKSFARYTCGEADSGAGSCRAGTHDIFTVVLGTYKKIICLD